MIAQAPDVGDQASRIIIVCLVLFAALIIFYVVARIFWRKWLKRPESGKNPWSLDDLRDLHQQGDITDEEYRAMRETIIAGFRGEKSETQQKIATGDSEEDISKNGGDIDLQK